MIYAKLGTGPAGYFNVLRKRKPPVVGDVIEIRAFVLNRGNWQQVRVSEIREVSGQPFYVLEQW